MGILIRIMISRWYVVASCLVLVAGIGASLSQSSRTYWTETEVYFVRPGGASVGSFDDGLAPSLIDFAGVVRSRVVSGGNASELPSSNVTLYGSGILNGYSVTLPNTGSQWAVSYSKPVLSIQVSGISRQEVSRTLQEVIDNIQRTAFELQSESGAGPESFIAVATSAGLPEVQDVSSSPASRAKGFAVLLAFGLVLSACLAFMVDRILPQLLTAGLKRVH